MTDTFTCAQIPAVLALLLYLLTGIATAAQVWYLLSWGIWGAPTSVLQYVALLGSVVLLIALYLPYRNLAPPRWQLFGGALLLWSFYGPVLYTFFRNAPLAFTFASAPVALLPATLLILVTGYTGTRMFRPSHKTR